MSTSCGVDNSKTNESVEIYLLKKYKWVTGKCKIDASHSVLQDTPIIRNQDILEYSQREYQFKLTDSGLLRMSCFQLYTPFAVTVDKQVVYYGLFIPSIWSNSCYHSIIMTNDIWSRDKINIRLGYPGELPTEKMLDERNNTRLLDRLKIQGKLR